MNQTEQLRHYVWQVLGDYSSRQKDPTVPMRHLLLAGDDDFARRRFLQALIDELYLRELVLPPDRDPSAPRRMSLATDIHTILVHPFQPMIVTCAERLCAGTFFADYARVHRHGLLVLERAGALRADGVKQLLAAIASAPAMLVILTDTPPALHSLVAAHPALAPAFATTLELAAPSVDDYLDVINKRLHGTAPVAGAHKRIREYVERRLAQEAPPEGLVWAQLVAERVLTLAQQSERMFTGQQVAALLEEP